MSGEAVSGVYATGTGGFPGEHHVTFSDVPGILPGYRPGAQAVSCTCGWHTVIDGGHSDEDRERLARQHAGTEDP